MADTRQLRLYDGRIVVCREYGVRNGWPVIWNHGGLLCGRDAETAHETARDMGLRLIAPNRPGIGGSANVEGRCTADWADDVEVIADAMGVEKFGAAGWSMGGQYALACAARLRGRVTRVVVVAGAVEMANGEDFQKLNEGDRKFTEISRNQPARARSVFRTLRWIARLAPWAFGRILGNQLGQADAVVISGLTARRVAHWYMEAAQNISGLTEEYIAWARPWGFRLEEVAAPVTVFRGTEDTLVPEEWARRLASEVKKGRYVSMAGGHFFLQNHWRAILEPLVK